MFSHLDAHVAALSPDVLVGQDAVVERSWRHLLDRWALDAVVQARVLARVDASWGSATRRISDGWLVLSGAGMYVNRAMRLGVDDDLTADDLDEVIAASRSAGVVPAIEVTPLTLAGSRRMLRQVGFVRDPSVDAVALIHSGRRVVQDRSADIIITEVRSDRELRLWQDAAAEGWGHVDADARRASDAFAAAAHASGLDTLLLGFVDGERGPVGCATLTRSDSVATLGGMSTLPSHRGRGIQRELIRHRVRLARDWGCSLVASMAAPGSTSARNLQRGDFNPAFTIETWKLSEPQR